MELSAAPLKAKWDYLSHCPAFRHSPWSVAFRLLAWRMRCMLRASTIGRIPQWKIQVFLPAQWRGIAKLIFSFRENYEPELGFLQVVLEPGKVVVDVGANFGIYSLAAARLVGDSGTVLAFEPAAESFGILEQNVHLNRVGNIRPFRMGLSDRDGKARLYHHADPGRNSLGGDGNPNATSEEITTLMLDSLLEREGIGRVDLLKIDVEGAEELVLRGAMAVLNRTRPIVIFELNHEAANRLGLSGSGAWDTLDSLGYHFFATHNDASLRELSSPPPGGNIIALPELQE